MPVPFNEAMYSAVKQWLAENPQDQRLPEDIKQSLLRFETLTDVDKEQLQAALLSVPELPDVLQQFMSRINPGEKLPFELLNIVGAYLTPQDRKELSGADKRMHSVFHRSSLQGKFLECIAYGQQEKAENLLGQVFQGQPAKIQAALLHQGPFTDYSGRKFNCSAYEYAYWAKDTHMCRMLEKYMDVTTKAQMLTRIEAIEANGLSYQQDGEERCSAHFDFTPLKAAYQLYIDNFDAWFGFTAENWDAMNAAWLDVGKAQRNVPAHVAQEYCRPDRSFSPMPLFNEATLPRVFTFHNKITDDRNNAWFPLADSNSGLGFDFALMRQGLRTLLRSSVGAGQPRGMASLDLAALIRLDEVRTADLTESRKNLNPPALSQGMSV